MKTNKKRIISILLVIVMMVTMISGASAEKINSEEIIKEDPTIENLDTTIEDVENNESIEESTDTSVETEELLDENVKDQEETNRIILDEFEDIETNMIINLHKNQDNPNDMDLEINNSQLMAKGPNDYVYMPDINLRRNINRFLERYGWPINGNYDRQITEIELEAVVKISMTGSGIESITGLEYAKNITTLNIDYNSISDLNPLKNLTTLKELWVGGKDMTTNISPLNGLINLSKLGLGHNDISDISTVKNLVNLETLFISDSEVSNLSPIDSLAKLKNLYVMESKVTDIRPLQNLIGLVNLQLDINNISDISPLQALTNLTILKISKNNITDLTPLRNLVNLTKLNLAYNNISDVTSLHGLTNLTELNLWFNHIIDFSPLKSINNPDVVRAMQQTAEIDVDSRYFHLDLKDAFGNYMTNVQTTDAMEYLGNGDFRIFNLNPLNQEEIKFTSDNDKIAGTIYLNYTPKYKNVKLNKTDQSGNPLQGAEFKIIGKDINKNVVSNQQGDIELGELEYGTYTITETKAPTGYRLDNQARELVVGDNSTLDSNPIATPIKNYKLTTNIVINKVDEKGNPLQGAEFELTGEGIAKKATSDSNGKVSFGEIAYGTYTITETKAPTGYILDNQARALVVGENSTLDSNPIATPIKNYKIMTNIVINKVDEKGDPLQGAEFRFKGEGVDKSVTSDANGKLNLGELAYGTYTITETKAPASFELDNNPKTLIVGDSIEFDGKIYSSGNLSELKIVNKKLLKSIELKKVNSEGNPLQGAEFKLSGNGIERVATSDANGKLSLGNLEYGTYTITETKAPVGYKKLAKQITLNVGDVIKLGDKDISIDNTVLNYLKEESLPDTGTLGILPYLLIGGLLIITGVVIYKKNTFKNTKNTKNR